jgi:hypothetical protein
MTSSKFFAAHVCSSQGPQVLEGHDIESSCWLQWEKKTDFMQ